MIDSHVRRERRVAGHRIRIVSEVAGMQDGAAVGQLEEDDHRARAVVRVDARDARAAGHLKGHIHRQDYELARR